MSQCGHFLELFNQNSKKQYKQPSKSKPNVLSYLLIKMKGLLILISIIALSNLCVAQSSELEEYLNKAKNEKSNLNELAALVNYKKALKINPRSVEALCGASIMSANIGERNSRSKKSLYEAAIIYAKTALKINPESAEANFALAVAYGRKVYTIMSPEPRIAMSAKIKKYAEQAVKYDDKHYEALTLLGIWHYERSTLTLAEKKIVSLLGGLPKGSLSQARQYLEKSQQIAPKNIATLLELGKVYKELGKTSLSRSTWKKALIASLQYQNDKRRKLEIKKRLAKS